MSNGDKAYTRRIEKSAQKSSNRLSAKRDLMQAAMAVSDEEDDGHHDFGDMGSDRFYGGPRHKLG